MFRRKDGIFFQALVEKAFEEIRGNSRRQKYEKFIKTIEYTVKELKSMNFVPEEVRHYEVLKF